MAGHAVLHEKKTVQNSNGLESSSIGWHAPVWIFVVEADHGHVVELGRVAHKVLHGVFYGLHYPFRLFVFRPAQGGHRALHAEQLVCRVGGLGHAVGVKEKLGARLQLQLIFLIPLRRI